MSEPLVDLTQPVSQKPRRTSQPKPPPKDKPKTTGKTTAVAGPTETPQQKARKAKVQQYQDWIEGPGSVYYLKGASMVAGGDLTQLYGANPDGTRMAKPVSDQFLWKAPKSLMAAEAAVALEETPLAKQVIAWAGPWAPWALGAVVLGMVGMDIVAVLNIRRIIHLQHAPGSPEQAEPQPQQPTQAAAPEAAGHPAAPVPQSTTPPATEATDPGAWAAPGDLGDVFAGEQPAA